MPAYYWLIEFHDWALDEWVPSLVYSERFYRQVEAERVYDEIEPEDKGLFRVAQFRWPDGERVSP